MPRLSKRSVDGAQPAATPRFVWDDALPGFGLLVHPSGRKVYVVQYRNAERRSRRITLGSHGVLTPEQARRIAASELAAARAGQDPAAERQEARRSLTVADLVARYIEEHLPKKKATSAREDRRMLRKYTLPALGKRKLGDVRQSDVARLHLALRATPVMANRVLFLVSTLFNLAERWGLRGEGTNPCRHVPRFRERKRERFLSDAELGRLGQALTTVEREKDANKAALAAIRLLVLTGARRGEVLRLRWEDVDLGRRVLRLPDSKTGAKVILLDDAAAALLAGLPRKGAWVFPSRTHAGLPLRDIRKTWWRVLERGELPGLRLHDLRHTHASVGAASGLSLQLIGSLLGHRRAATTERYAHLVDDAQRAAASLVQGRIAAALAGQQPAKVLPLRR
jgi:integrase